MLEILQTHTHLCKTLKCNFSKCAVSIDDVAKFWWVTNNNLNTCSQIRPANEEQLSNTRMQHFLQHRLSLISLHEVNKAHSSLENKSPISLDPYVSLKMTAHWRRVTETAVYTVSISKEGRGACWVAWHVGCDSVFALILWVLRKAPRWSGVWNEQWN